MKLKKWISILLAVCVLCSLSVPTFAGIVEADKGNSLIERRPICTECGSGYMYSSATFGYWANTGLNRRCIHGRFGFDLEQEQPVVLKSWCDNPRCGISSTVTTYEVRWACDGY